MSEDLHRSTPAASAASPSKPVFGLFFLATGLLVLFAAAMLDARDRRSQIWGGMLFALEGGPPWADALTIHVRDVPLHHFPTQQALYDRARDTITQADAEAMGLDMTERIISVDMPSTDFEALLESGRPPVPGKPELVAGVYARLERFDLDGATFEVVGRLQSGIPGLHFAYLLPNDPAWKAIFAESAGATTGWLDPKGMERIADLEDPEAFVKREAIASRQAPVRTAYAYLVTFGLLLIATGGALVHLALFQFCAPLRVGALSPIFTAVAQHRRLVLGMHVFLYGGFFVSMLMSLRLPVVSIFLQEYIAHEFREGGLSYIGAAYESGDIFRATGATFLNNYLLQTVVLTICASFVVPMIGVLKTLASFVLVGFGMAPLWSGMASMFTFHSITMTLEFEGYIFACIAVCVFWIHVLRGVGNRQFAAELVAGLKVVGSGALLSGLMLALAGLYEATTLILLM